MEKTIAWIDDDNAVIADTIFMLEDAGYTFERFSTATAALNNIEVMQQADLILLDMILPEGQTEYGFGRYPGLKILEELRYVHKVKTPVIVLTVVTNPEILEALQEPTLDVGDIINKPVLPSELKERVERVLEARR